MGNLSKKVCGLLLLLMGLVLGGWIAYNLLVEMQPEARGQDPLLAILFSIALISLGFRLWRGGPRVTRVKNEGPRRILCLALLLALPALPSPAPARAVAAGRGPRTVSGIIYFTNNSQPDEAITVELLTRDTKKRLASMHPRESNFKFDGLEPDRYVLRLRWRECVLNYAVDARAQQVTAVRVVMDAACANEEYEPGDVRPQPPPPGKDR